MSYRQAQILGRAGGQPDTRTVNDGTPMASVSVATETYRDDETVWVTVVAFGQTAKFLADYCGKGDYVFASGRPQIDTWESKGEKQVKFELVADDVKVPKLSGGGGSGGKSAGGGGQPPPSDPAGEPFDDSEIPF